MSGLQHVASEPVLARHFPPKYDVFGHHLPVGKISGLGAPSPKREPRADYPEEWSREVDVKTTEDVLQKRQKEDTQILAKAQSAMVIRSKAELTGSQQMESLLKGRFHAVEHPETQTRSRLLGERRNERLEEIKNGVGSYIEPKLGLYEHADTLEPGKLVKPCILIPLPDDVKDRAVSRAQSALPGNSKHRIGPVREIISERPNAPGLGWRPEQRTKDDMLLERAAKANLERTQALDNYSPREKVLRTRPRQASPLKHIEIDHHDFGRTTKKQYPFAHTREKLLDVRREDLRVELEGARQGAEARQLAHTDQITQPVLKSSSPWWELEKSTEQLDAMRTKRNFLADDFERRVHEICPHPAQSGEYRHLQLQLRANRGKLADKPSKIIGLSESAQPAQHTRKNKFTDAVIAFRNQGMQPELDENGKKLRYDPGETNALYSSFTPDNKFLERLERIEAARATRAREAAKLMGNVLPRRSYIISRASSSPALMRGGQNSHKNTNECILGPNAVLGGQLEPEKIRSGGFQLSVD